jgi:hypothetical protein
MMKITSKKTIGLAFGLIAGLLTTLTAEAASVSGTLGTSIVAADSYAFTCPTGTTKSRIRVMDLNTITNRTATVFATFGKKGSPTLAVADTESTSTGSTNITNPIDGAGIYGLVVNKSAVNAEDYIVTVECLNSAGTLLPVSLILKTNQ